MGRCGVNEVEFYPHYWKLRVKLRGWKAFRCKKCKCYVITKTMESRYLSEKSCTVS